MQKKFLTYSKRLLNERVSRINHINSMREFLELIIDNQSFLSARRFLNLDLIFIKINRKINKTKKNGSNTRKNNYLREIRPAVHSLLKF